LKFRHFNQFSTNNFGIKETHLSPIPGVKRIKTSKHMGSNWYITGRSKKSLNDIKSMFVMPGDKFADKTMAQRLADANEYVGKKGIKDLKKYQKLRSKLAKRFAWADDLFKKTITREVTNDLMPGIKKSANITTLPKIKKTMVKINLDRLINARGKGVRFIRKNNRIIPIRTK
jgi:hypothetical protein